VKQQQMTSILCLRRCGIYTLASEPSRIALELIVAHITDRYQCAAVAGAGGHVGFEPSFARLEHAGRRGFTLTASLYGREEAYRLAGLGEILVPPRPGYSRVRISEADRLPAFLAAFAIGWREREQSGRLVLEGGGR
jgi:hypothetical protein